MKQNMRRTRKSGTSGQDRTQDRTSKNNKNGGTSGQDRTQDRTCKGLTFEECETMLLQNVVERIERTQGEELMKQPEIQNIIRILENFLSQRKRICYGGTAINSLLPKEDQFYDKSAEFPDYDFYSPTPIQDAKELADRFAKAGYTNVEAKSGVHIGTYKVFVDFIPVADITELPLVIYTRLQKDSIKRNNIYYAPPNFLRMSMYLELSRPQGAVTRWEKVYSRLKLLNKHYPFISKKISEKCTTQRGKISKTINIQRQESTLSPNILKKIYKFTKEFFIEKECVFFGAYAHQLYSKYMPSSLRRKNEFIPDFDVLSTSLKQHATELYNSLKSLKLRDKDSKLLSVNQIYHEPIGELLPEHVEIRVGDESVCVLYSPLACHSYNTIKINNQDIHVATIDTMLSFYLAFYYLNRDEYDEQRILCMSDFLVRVQEKNRLVQKGLLKRFTMECYGEQETVRDIRDKRAKKYKEFRRKRRANKPIDTEEFERYFFRYVPTDSVKKPQLYLN